MPKVRENQDSINSIKGKLATINDLLQDMDSEYAKTIVDWMRVKINLVKADLTTTLNSRVPRIVTMGDIVRIDYGTNIPPEFSDDETDKHFGLVWGRQGYNIIIIPLTKTPQPANNPYAVNLGRINGLPMDTDTYAKIEAIRSISIKRVIKMFEKPEGKIRLTDETAINRINEIFQTLFIKNP